MAKIVKLLLLVIVTCSTLFATINYIEELQYFDKKIEISNDDELLRVHHALKSIYIRSIVENNPYLKKETLKRLAKTANILKLDVSGYSKELATMQKKVSDKRVATKNKTEIVQKKKNIKTKQRPLRNNYYPLRLKSIFDKGDRLVLNFDRDVKTKDVNSFQLKSVDNFREVFDIRATLAFVPSLKVPKALDDLRIAQFNSKTLRVVFQKNSILKSNIVLSGSKIEIFYTEKKEEKKDTKLKIEKSYEKFTKSLPLNKIIVIDAGHGGKDPGAVAGKGKYEKYAALKITLKVGRILKERGYRVYYTRTTDKFVRLRDRTRFANKKKAELFLSIHANAAKNRSLNGVETYFLSPARSERSKRVAALENKAAMEDMEYFSKKTFLNVFNRAKIVQSNKLAIDIQQGMINRLKKHYKVKDGGVREAPFWVLVGAQMPAVLIEVGYMSNKIEKKRIFNSHYQSLIAKGIADGVDSYFIKNE